MDAAAKDINRLIGKRLREARILRGFSQKKLAQITGVSFQQVQKYEKGANGISPARMKRFAESLGVTVNHLFGAADMEIPPINASRARVLALMKALHRLERQNPAAVAHLCKFIVGLAESTNG